MHVLTLSWEYPPKIVGGIARVVHDLTKEMVRQGVEVTVITCGAHDLPEYEQDGKLHIYRVLPYPIEHYDFLQWVTHLNLAMAEKAARLVASGASFDMIHAHDWITAYSSKVLKGMLNCPLVSTIHATEWGRNDGLHNDLQRYISNVEWYLAYESARVIVNSRYMENQLGGIFQLPQDKIRIVPNGVDASMFQSDPLPTEFKCKYAQEDEKVLFYVGRLVQEKGVHLILEAIPIIAAAYPRFKVIIAGKGPGLEPLRRMATQMGIDDRIYFTGFIDDDERNRLYRIADAAIFPSLYEPFGIVALEGMAARVPVVVADTGGLRETVDNGVDGLKFEAGSSADLSEKLLYLLNHPEEMQKMGNKGYEKVMKHFNWCMLTEKILGIYSEVLTHNIPSVEETYKKGWFDEGYHYGRW